MNLTRWFRRRPSDDEMRRELELHVAMRAAHDGVDEAAARRRLGNMLQTRESMHRVWIAEWWDALRQDAWFTWRSWRRQPGFALGAILVLALGLGASTALFAALDRVLFRPLPYPEPDRLVSVGRITVPLVFPGQTEIVQDRFYVQEWDAPPAPFQSATAMMALVGPRTCEIAEGQQEGLRCDQVEHNFLRVLGVGVALGRDFAPEDDVREAPPVAIISHALWVRRFGSDPGAINRTLRLERASLLVQARVIGVLPPGFEMPFETADILLPARLRPIDPKSLSSMLMTVLARLRPDVTPERAALMLETQGPKPPAMPGMREEWRVRSVWDRRVGDARRAAWLLVAAVSAFLLIACVNVTNLMLVRVGERRREFEVRAAIGAGRMRLARLALAESLLLSLAAGAIGLLVAFVLLQTFVAMAPPGIPGIANASLDLRVFTVAALLMVLTGMAIGVWPAVSVFRAGNLHGLRTTATTSGSARPRLRFALVTTQIALTLALLGGSALLLRSLWNVVSVPLGFNAERVVTLDAGLGRVRYPTLEHGAAFLDELFARTRSMPGVIAAAMSDTAPPPSSGPSTVGWEVEGRPTNPKAPLPRMRVRSVTPDYFETLQIPVRRGRTFQEGDVAGEPAVALNESAERALFAGASAIGRRLRLPALSGRPNQLAKGAWYTVIGVIADTRNGPALTDEPIPELYFPARPGRWSGPSAVLAAFSSPSGHLSLRTTAGPEDVAAFLRQIVADIDPRQLVTIQTSDEQMTRLTAQPRFIASLLTAFAALALLLAAVGLYSVAAYLVTQRRRDMAVRVALGAAPRDVAGHVVGEAGRWIIGGAVVGSALGWMGTRALQSQLYQVEALDPWSWAGALLALALVLMIAVFRPAYRAAHVDPVTALRAD